MVMVLSKSDLFVGFYMAHGGSFQVFNILWKQ